MCYISEEPWRHGDRIRLPALVRRHRDQENQRSDLQSAIAPKRVYIPSRLDTYDKIDEGVGRVTVNR